MYVLHMTSIIYEEKCRAGRYNQNKESGMFWTYNFNLIHGDPLSRKLPNLKLLKPRTKQSK